MTTFTLNRTFDNDSIFVAMNDGCYADWRDSQVMDPYNVKSGLTFRERLLEFFHI